MVHIGTNITIIINVSMSAETKNQPSEGRLKLLTSGQDYFVITISSTSRLALLVIFT